MRKSFVFTSAVLLILGTSVLNAAAAPYDHPSSSIRFNFGVWDTPGGDIGVTVHHSSLNGNERLTDTRVSGLSGSFAFSHMVGQRFAWELSMGGFSDSESEILSRKVSVRQGRDHYETISSNTQTVSVGYVMVGLIYYPLYELDDVESDIWGALPSFIRPYLTAGIGPYFGSDVRWNEDDITDADFATAMGAYPGVGMDLLLSRHFIFNIDLRYHFIEFGEPLRGIRDYSGTNVVAGFKIAF